MSRENFVMKLRNAVTGKAEYINVSNITRMVEHAKEEAKGTVKEKPAHTMIYHMEAEGTPVMETVAEIERKGSATGVFKVIGDKT